MQFVFDALAAHAAARPDAVAFRDNTDAVSWSQLVSRVAGMAKRLENAPQTVAIALAGGVDYVVADLALSLTGRQQIPLPFFFSEEQINHVLATTGAQAVVAAQASPWTERGLAVISLCEESGDATLPPAIEGASRVIYTSGSSGNPKGVVIGASQLRASLAALAPIVGAGSQDRHLSVLPLAQLLEQICGIFLPILAGAECVMDMNATKAIFGGPIDALVDAAARNRPTTTLLVPGLLSRWAAALAASGTTAPDSLRFVAVGGAASSPALIAAAHAVGIPAHEGYGLSECCAVVAMNRPGDNKPGTVGRVLDGLDVKIIDGEITVAGPTVMTGYLGADAAPSTWRTGDLGRFEGGRLVVEGRKDNLIVTNTGRNISPEWVERRVDADPRVVASALTLLDDRLVLLVAPAAPLTASEVAALLYDLPNYVRPEAILLVDPRESGLLFAAGTPNRKTVDKIVSTRPTQPLPAREKERLAS